MRRAVEDIRRLIQIKTAKQACGALLARGSVGDDLWQRFERAEKEMDEELRDVVVEVSRVQDHLNAMRQLTRSFKANALAPNWGSYIFQSAHEMHVNTAVRSHLDEVLSQTDSEKEWWEKHRKTIETEQKEPVLAEEPKDSPTKSTDEDAVIVDTPSQPPVETPVKSSKKKGKGKK